jgi:CRP-like cAMP-binding protein
MRYYTRVTKNFKPGEMVFTENSECDGMYIIDTGRVRVFKTIGSGKERKEVELCTLGAKAMFGEMAMIDEKRRSASVQAVEPTVCTIITRKIFEDQLQQIPGWMVNMIRILVSRLRDTNDRLRKMVQEYTNQPVEDTGGILTVDAEEQVAAPSGSQSDAADGGKESQEEQPQPRKFQSDEIVQSLFRKDGDG